MSSLPSAKLMAGNISFEDVSNDNSGKFCNKPPGELSAVENAVDCAIIESTFPSEVAAIQPLFYANWLYHKFCQLERCNEVVDMSGKAVGTVLLTRQRMVDLFVTKLGYQKFPHYYIRGPRGCGKTTFINLVGKKLLSMNYDVYFFDAPNQLTMFDDKMLCLKDHIARNRRNNIRTAFIVDEADLNLKVTFFTALANSHFYDDVVLLCAGITEWDYFVDITYQLPAEWIVLQKSDAVELTSEWMKISALNGITVSRTDMVGFCEWVIEYTHGNTFMVMMMCHHFFTSVAIFNAHFNTYEEYLTSSFLLTDDFAAINRRCIGENTVQQFGYLNVNGCKGDAIAYLVRLGHWSRSTNCFFSRLMLTVFCNVRAIVPDDVDRIHVKALEKVSVREKVEALIILGLFGMRMYDFEEFNGYKDRDEDGLGFGWQRSIRAHFHTLLVEPRPRPNLESPQTLIDFKFSGSLNVAIELNRDNQDLVARKGHLKRLTTGGVYELYKDTAAVAVLVFQVTTDERPAHDDFVYYFNVSANTLHRGDKLICSGVSKFLATPAMSKCERAQKKRMFQRASKVAKYFTSESNVVITKIYGRKRVVDEAGPSNTGLTDKKACLDTCTPNENN